MMRFRLWLLLIFSAALLQCQGCRHSDRLPQEERAAVEASVRQFTAAVAHDVSAEGPTAWSKYFSDSPDFFMAVNGKLAFPSGQAAAQEIPKIAGQIKHIGLQWGDDLRLDALTRSLCMVAGSYREEIELTNGAHLTENGYFTGLAEKRNGQWQFRNAHWSQPMATAVP